MACCFVSPPKQQGELRKSLYPSIGLQQAAESGLIWKVEKDASRGAGIGAVTVIFIYMGLFTVSKPLT